MLIPNFGRACANHINGESNPRMPIIARTWLTTPGGTPVPFYCLQDHFGENTDVPAGMFKTNPSYPFRPVVSVAHGTLLYRNVPDFSTPPPLPYWSHQTDSPWNTCIPFVPEVEAEQLTTRTAIEAAKNDFKPIVGRIELTLENGIAAVVEFPVSMVAVYPNRWHMQAGPVLFPRWTEEKPHLIQYLNIANAIFNEFGNFGYAEFLMEDALQIRPEVNPMVRVLHFWRVYQRACTVTLWALPLESSGGGGGECPVTETERQTALAALDTIEVNVQIARNALT